MVKTLAFGAIATISALLAAYSWARARRSTRMAREAIQRAEEAIAEKQRFIAAVGHEVRNPLMAIHGMAELLSQAALPHEQRDHVNVIRDATDNLLFVQNNLLAYMAGTEPFDVYPTLIDVPDLIRTAVDALTVPATERQLQLTIQIDEGAPGEARVDGNHLRQVIGNVMAHAIGISFKGSVTIRLSAAGDIKQSAVNIEISDNGPTLSEPALADLFKPYGLRGRISGGNPLGTGLALHNAREFARLVGGDVATDPARAPGTTFVITVPAEIFTLHRSSAERKAIRSNIVPFPSLPRSILVAEDQLSNLEVITTVLKGAGHRVTVACDGNTALDYIRRQAFDIAIVDLLLPGTPGIDVIKLSRLTDERHNDRMRIIVLTGDASEQTRSLCHAAGADAYLVKPVARRRLLETISRIATTINPDRPPGSKKSPTTLEKRRLISSATGAAELLLAPRLISDTVRAGLRLLAELQNAGYARDWSSVVLRARAIAGTAYLIGAHDLVKACSDLIDSRDDDIEATWRQHANNLASRLDDARFELEELLRSAAAG